MKKFLALILAVMMGLSCFGAIAVAEEEAGFDEFEVGPEEENDHHMEFMNVRLVYFQPVDMEPAEAATPKEDSDLHIEADIIVVDENDLGYPVDTWVPYLTINYTINDANGNIAAEGTMMPMAASDGPHYGDNVKLAEGSYSVTISIVNPGTNYLLHVDEETGVTGRFWEEPLTATWNNWDFIKQW